jgi:hypothetical protein
MHSVRLTLGSSLALVLASVAQAQVQRTFVSGLGSDSNPCSRTAPCRTFTQAISQTNTGGEVYVLDSAGYGAFTIAKSVTIVAPQGVVAGISVFSGDGIDVNAGGSGIKADSDLGGPATLRISNSTVTANGIGLQNFGSPALLLSRGDNTVEGNQQNTSGTIGSYSGK